jgi:cyanophycinase-like exopeptidase
MIKQLLIIPILLISITVSAQSYTSYFTGSAVDTTTIPNGGVCMMGGATEHDEAMKWFLERAKGGDVLVLRASGSDGYNDYLYTDLGISVNSVETIVFDDSSASAEGYIHDKIQKAEAIWFAGGDQWDYVSYWRDSPIDSLINDALQNRNIVIGGTSAGMAILGNYYFSAENGTITSDSALNNPYDSKIAIGSESFLQVDYLQDVITDSHYADRDRKGRHVTFLARILTDKGIAAKGIACNEYTAVCIDENGLASVFGDYPNYPETTYFLQTNCELSDINPENCATSVPLNWNLGGTAIKVYKVNGTNNGANTFDLSDWKTGTGGEWENWHVDNGTLVETASTQLDCSVSSINHNNLEQAISVFPNPMEDIFFVNAEIEILAFEMLDITGKSLLSKSNINDFHLSIDVRTIPKGIYILKLKTNSGLSHVKLLKE